MKKRFWISAMAACGITLAAVAAPTSTIAKNSALALKEVDLNGEMLYWNDLTFLTPLINEKIPAAVKLMIKNSEAAPTINQAVQSVLKLINIQAFKGMAASSVESYPGIYTYKSFVLIDMQAKSIFLDKKQKNLPLNWQSLPADTRVAVKCQIDLAHVWQMISDEMKNNPDPTIKKLFIELETGCTANGIDINQLAAALNGEVELLLTGSNIQDIAAKVVIPDKNGALSGLLKQALPPQQGTNTAIIPTPLGINIQVIYEAGRITAVSHPKLLQRPEKTLASVPHFQQYATLLPANGNGYFILDIPAEVLNMLKASFSKDAPEEMASLFDTFISPLSLAVVSQVTPDGGKSVMAANFSLAQLQIIAPGIASIATQAAILLPALQQARDRGRQANCINNMKQFGTACVMYADAKNGMFPPDINALLKDGYITKSVVEDIILLYPNGNFNKLQTPSQTPLAMCDRASHSESRVCLLFADCHVQTFPVPADADDDDVIRAIGKELNLNADLINLMLKQVSAE